MARFLGIDIGTQGLSVVLTDEDLRVIATGEGGYEMVEGLAEGCYEQRPADWEAALRQALQAIQGQLQQEPVTAVGVSGQMHGEVLVGTDGDTLGPARLWCDTRNQAEADELTERFGCKVPRRCTVARWLWTIRHQPERAARVRHLTTPAGWIAHRLAGVWRLGVGEASGVFPIDQSTLDYDAERLAAFDRLVGNAAPHPLRDLLPEVRVAGGDAGTVTAEGDTHFGTKLSGAPIAPAEGDQPAAMAGSLIGKAGMVSVSFGTSVCANAIGDRPFQGVSPAVDHFCAVDGKPINMVWLRNGTTFMNTVVGALIDGALEGTAEGDRGEAFGRIMAAVVDAPADCGGLLATPFIDDEAALQVTSGGQAMLLNLTPENAKPACIAKAALLATVFNLRLGSETLDRQGYPRTQVVLTGGLAQTPELGQVIADAMRTPVALLDNAEEGTAWGAALLAKYRWQTAAGQAKPWPEFLAEKASAPAASFTPNEADATTLDAVYRRYQQTPPLAAARGATT